MHPALRSSLALLAIVACLGCQTHDRRMYSTHKEKNLHLTDPFAPSTKGAADDATQSLNGMPDATTPVPPVAPGVPH